ncbi:polysaccharide biosynthesis C-terminal domain-containing protein [Pseudoclostridium thermosuccinogenes]|uniref:oligosaccharide flippase family protein n=1 Tax=Clostridium thermosuccinogenes TaxID=84032 RepID=UPI002FDA1479
METSNFKARMAKDTLLYAAAKILEGIIGLVTLSTFTILFKSEKYGDYNTIITTVNIACIFLLEWLVQSVFRYINSYSGKMKLTVFYSTVFTIWGAINSIVMIVSLSLVFALRNVLGESLFSLILASVFMLLGYSATRILFSLLGAARIIKLNLILSVLSAGLKLVATIVLVKAFNMGIFGAVLGNILVDSLSVFIIIWRLKLHNYIRLGFFSKRILNKFIKYGFPLVGLSLTMSMLNMSDRYIVRFFKGASQQGIYAGNYAVASAVFTMILFAVMRGVYPTILKSWKANDKSRTEEMLSHAVRYFLLIAVPSAVGLSVLSPYIARVMMEPEFHEGSSVIIWVSTGMFLLGLTEYCNKAWELTSSTGRIFKNSLISCGVNIAANLILVPIYGYKAAAVNTALAYLVYFLLAYTMGRKILKWTIPALVLARIFGSAGIMALVICAITAAVDVNLPILILLVLIGAATYFSVLFLTGEIKGEVRQIIAYVGKRFSGNRA